MPRDAVAITALASGAGTAQPAGTTINVGNGATIPAKSSDRLVVRVTNTAGAEKEVTFKAGVNPPAIRKGIGDLVVKLPATTGDVLVVLETARHAQADGSILADFSAATAGIISAVRIPKAV